MTQEPIFAIATEDDAVAVAAIHVAVAARLTEEHGRGHWSRGVTDEGVLRGVRTSRVLVARRSGRIVATLRLHTKKPWAIDPAYFTSVRRPIYLSDMAVEPGLQRQGIGRALVEHAMEVVAAWPGDAIRLDAYDGPAGAGAFYARCGFREVGRVRYRSTPLVYFEMRMEAT